MSVAWGYARYTAGCSDRCLPQAHDLLAHERCGYERGYAVGYEACRTEQAERTVRTGTLVVELRARRAWVAGAEITTISGREWGVLAYLAERVGQWCPNDEIVSAVWGPEWLLMRPYGAAGHPRRLRVAPHILAVVLCRLRPKLGVAGALIATNGSRSRSDAGCRLEDVPPGAAPKGGPV